MAVVTAAVTGVVGVGASIYGGMQQADAARKAGQAGTRASQDWISYTAGQRDQALQAYGEYSSTQQASIDKAIHAQQANLDRQQRLVDSINPALLEAGSQMTKLLQGQSAPVLQNLKDQRQTQRQSLLDSLRQQLGPGGETSQAGLNALRKFDADTSNQLSTAQQSYLQQVQGLAIGGGQTLAQSLGQASSELAKLGDQYGNIGATKANIIEGFQNSADRAMQSNVNTAGSQYAGDFAQGAMTQNLGGQLGKLGGIIGATDWGGSPKDSGVSSGIASGNQFTMPTLGSSAGYGQQPTNYYGLGTLGSSVSQPSGLYAGSSPSFGWSPQSQTYLKGNQ